MEKTIKRAWLLLWMAALLPLLFVPLTAFAEDTAYTITVMVQRGEDSSTAIADDGTYVQVYGATKLTANTYSFSPTSGDQLRVVSNSVKGYYVYQWQVSDSVDGDSTSSLHVTDFTIGSVSGDSTVTVIYYPNEYNISYENEDGFNGASLSFTATPPYTHTYGQATTLVAPKELQTHTFRYWSVYSTDGVTETLLGTREAGEVLNANEITTDLVLVAHWEPKSFTVTRHEYYYDADSNQQEFATDTPITKEAEFASSVSGKEDGWSNDVTHRGYTFDADSATEGTDYTVLDAVSYVEANNTVSRVYTARTYTVVFDNCDLGSITHTFGTDTVLSNPEKTGYTFAGWQIILSNGDDWKTDYVTIDPEDSTWSLNGENGVWTMYGDAYDSSVSGSVTVQLRAKWEAVQYTVSYDSETTYGNDLTSLVSSYYYESGAEITVPDTFVREGYTFLGWRISGSSDEPADPFVIKAKEKAENITLEAVWQANTYTVTYDPANGSATETADVTYDGTLPAITVPTREGYDFGGYYLGEDCYYTADGSPSTGKTWTTAGDATLTAQWTIRQHKVTVSVTDGQGNSRLSHVTVLVNGVAYDSSAAYDYLTEITVSVEVLSGEADKIVSWDAAAVSHCTKYSTTFSLGDSDTEVVVIILPKAETPSFGVDYPGETLTGFTGKEGIYQIEVGDSSWSFKVLPDGSISPYNSDHADPIRLTELFGSTVTVLKITKCGDGTTDSDSDPQEITLAARPAAPDKTTNSIQITSSVADETKLEITLNTGNLVYEYAYTLTADATPDNWQDSSTLEGLSAGTPYYVHIRVKAVDNVCPHGEIYTEVATTEKEGYLRDWIEKLYGDFESYTGGTNVKKLLESAEQEAKDLQPSADYEAQLDSIYQKVADNIAFEKSRDDAVAEIRAYYEKLIRTEAYNQSGGDELLALLNSAIEQINSDATTSEVDVQRATLTTYQGMDEVRINYLSSITEHSEVNLYSTAGLPKGTVLSAEQGDVSSVRSQLSRALRRGTVVVDQTNSAETTEDAEAMRKILSSMDAMAFYRMMLSATPDEGDVLEFRLLIPEELRSENDFRVVYYDNRSETVTSLEAGREGNELVFYASSAADFILLVEHVTNTIPIILILSGILLLELLAVIALVLGHSRSKASSVALPVMLALLARIQPAGSLTAVTILAVAVVVLMIVLVWMVIGTGITWKKKPEKPDTEAEDELSPTSEEEPDENTSEETIVNPETEEAPAGFQTETESEKPAVERSNMSASEEPVSQESTPAFPEDIRFGEVPQGEKPEIPESPEDSEQPEAQPKQSKADSDNPFAAQAEDLWGDEKPAEGDNSRFRMT